MSATSPRAPAARSWLSPQVVERTLRFGAGVILMVFVTLHLLNHAAGVFGIEAITAMQEWRVALWRNPVGTALLYGALAVHIALALRRLLARRTLRMPWPEAAQVALALAIPILLTPHALGTRYMAGLGINDAYVNVLRNLWPGLAWWQTALVIVVWSHGVIGIHQALRNGAWYRRHRNALRVAAVTIPLLALAGFVASGREAQGRSEPRPEVTEAHVVAFNRADMMAKTAMWGGLALVLGVFCVRGARRLLTPQVSVRYVGHGSVRSPVGMTLLEMSRSHKIPHPSVCGGRGRCSTCRVLVTNGHESLSAPTGIERRLLDRIRAPQRVRLACQIRPDKPIGVRVLLPDHVGDDAATWEAAALDWGTEQEVAIVFADIRAFSSLARNQLPADAVSLLNRVIADMTQAVEARGGHVALVPTDGVMAIFRDERSLRRAARGALLTALDILRAVDATNRELGSALPQPLRAGVGVHVGSVIVARIGDGERGHRLTAIGEAVFVADSLEAASKEHAVDAMISQAALDAAGVPPPPGAARPVAYKHGATSVPAYAFADAAALDRLMGDRARSEAPDDAVAGA